jgi:hypothetical protein
LNVANARSSFWVGASKGTRTGSVALAGQDSRHRARLPLEQPLNHACDAAQLDAPNRGLRRHQGTLERQTRGRRRVRVSIPARQTGQGVRSSSLPLGGMTRRLPSRTCTITDGTPALPRDWGYSQDPS